MKTLVVGAIALVAAVFIGDLVGEGDWVLPVLLLVFAGATGVYTLFFRSLRIEALLLGFLLFGYIVGNRGFAQISLGGPLFFGEICLAICACVMLARLALQRKPLGPRSGLSIAIAVFMAIGVIRLYFDFFLHSSGGSKVEVLRDSATVYYAGFFYIAYQLGQLATTRRFLLRCLVVSFLVLLPIAVIEALAPLQLWSITFRGSPLILHRGDILVVSLQAASILFFLLPARGGKRLFWRALSAACCCAIFLFPSRAVFLGLTATVPFLLRGGQWRYFLLQASVGAVALLAALSLQASGARFNAEMVKSLADKLESIMDISGTHSYHGETGEISADNNQFRLVWWKSVATDTMSKGPWFGLGFGYDLAESFVRDYYMNSGEFEVRSPHSIWLTVFGRMGFFGMVSFTVVVLLIIKNAWQAADVVRAGDYPREVLFLWCGAIILLVAASFGVVLEGPMGGVLFWSFVGLGYSSTRTSHQPQEQPETDELAFEQEPEFEPVLGLTLPGHTVRGSAQP